VRFLHAADIHLDSPLVGLERYEGAPSERLRGATRLALDGLVALAIDEEVAFVVVAGDLYDGDWRDYNTGLFFNSCMGRLGRAGIRVVVAAGNHDATSRLTRSLRSPDNVTFLSSARPQTVVIEEHGVAIHGQGYPTGAVTDDLSAGYPEPVQGLLNVGVLHTSVDGRPGHAPYAPCTIAGLTSRGYDYWALGHVHRREVLHEAPWVVFPGCLQGRHVRETGAKGCTIAHVEDGEVRGVEHREVDVVRWAVVEVDAAGAAGGDAVVDRARAALAEALESAGGRPLAARLRVTGACPAHGELATKPARWRNELVAAANDLGDVWLEKVLLGTRAEVRLDELRAADDALAALLRGLDELEDDPEALLALAADVAPLERSLPPELREGDGRLDLLGPDALREALGDVRELLVARLCAAAGEP